MASGGPSEDYQIEGNRFNSYGKRWPSDTAKKLAIVGFLYTGSGTRVKCFHCNIEYDHRIGDDPLVKHRMLSPDCSLLPAFRERLMKWRIERSRELQLQQPHDISLRNDQQNALPQYPLAPLTGDSNLEAFLDHSPQRRYVNRYKPDDRGNSYGITSDVEKRYRAAQLNSREEEKFSIGSNEVCQVMRISTIEVIILYPIMLMKQYYELASFHT